MMAFIVARLGSTRLPKKAIRNISGVPLFVRLAERIKTATYIDEVAVVTSTHESDDEFQEICDVYNIPCFRGSLLDISKRIVEAAEHYKIDIIVEILGDNVFVCPNLIDECIRNIHYCDYVSIGTNEYDKLNKNFHKFPLGIRPQVYTLESLKKFKNFEKTIDAHTSFMFKNDEFNSFLIEASGRFSKYSGYENLNLAVNYDRNLIGVKNVYRRFGKHFSTVRVIEVVTSDDLLMEHFKQCTM